MQTEAGTWTWVNDDGRELVFIPKGATILGRSTDSLSQLTTAPSDTHGNTGASASVESDTSGNGGNATEQACP